MWGYQGGYNQTMAQRSWVGHLVGFGDPNFKVPMVGGGGALH